ncbi:hypothetical protein CDAR_92491 [Caerostris darwini]|uniref:Uncharacterized protein n=1 Tax=Caerostris darwini TaxID=1538125 RepID=A0AAV4PDU7_9ARAC|nr:hypothetical protein CDAR_92491 [Caerostris darwini]
MISALHFREARCFENFGGQLPKCFSNTHCMYDACVDSSFFVIVIASSCFLNRAAVSAIPARETSCCGKAAQEPVALTGFQGFGDLFVCWDTFGQPGIK